MEALENAAALFKLLSHPSRLAILQVLRQGEECVCRLAATLGLRQAYISQQLMVLRQAGLVTDRREGWNVFYRAAKPEVYALLDIAFTAAAPGSARLAAPLVQPPTGCAPVSQAPACVVMPPVCI